MGWIRRRGEGLEAPSRLSLLLVVLVSTALVAGCASLDLAPGAPAGGIPGGALSCPPPCEVGIHGAPERAFEPDVAADPNDPLHLVAASSVMERDAAGAEHRWTLVHITEDGGVTWETVRLPGGPGAPPDHTLATMTDMADPIVGFLHDGTVLVGGMAFSFVQPGAGAGAFTAFNLFVARSTDGGRTFPEVVIVAEGRGGGAGAPIPLFGGAGVVDHHDKPMLASDARGTVLMAWSNIQFPPTDEAGSTFRADLAFSVSKDGGRTWREPAIAVKGGEVSGAAPAIAPDGAYHIAYMEYVQGLPLGVATSRDDGATWKITPLGSTGAMAFPTLRLAPGGRLILAHAIPGESDGHQVPVVRTSDDDGATWTEPFPVDTPEAPGFVTPALAVDGEGRAFVSFFHPIGEGEENEYRVVALTPDGALLGPIRVDGTPVGKQTMSASTGLGHYMGLAGLTGGGAYAVWVSGEAPETDVRGARVLVS